MSECLAPTLHWKDHLSSSSDMPTQLLNWALKYGDFFKIRSTPSSYLVSNPVAIDHILKVNMGNYQKDFREYQRLGALMGKGLLTNMDATWLARRKDFQAYFYAKHFSRLDEILTDCTDKLCERWQWFAKHSQPLNIVPEILNLVLQIALKYMFNTNATNDETNKLVRHFGIAQYNLLHALSLKKSLPTVSNIRFHYHRKKIVVYAEKLIAQRRAQSPALQPDDFLTFLINYRDESSSKPLSQEDIINELITFMGTGHETIGNGIVWSLYCLAQHPEIATQLHVEAKNNHIHSANVNMFRDTRQVIQETIRLYPPIWNFARNAVEQDNWNNFLIPAKSVMIICPYVLHRLPQYWPEPNKFIPERFSDEQTRLRPRLAFLPFGFGPHICIASQLSMVQMQLILSKLMHSFKMTLLPESKNVALEPLISLRPKTPIRVILQQL